MQKELRVLDKQLRLNGLRRIGELASKSEHSLFRALSLVLYRPYCDEASIINYLKLSLLFNIMLYEDKRGQRHNPFPEVSINIVRKYADSPLMFEQFWNHPEYSCFARDIYEMVCWVFGCSLSLYYLDGENYLNQAIFNADKHPRLPKNHLNLSKISSGRYFGIQKIDLHEIFQFIKDVIILKIVTFVEEKDGKQENRVHYPLFDEVVGENSRRQHRKSLSQPGNLLESQLPERKLSKNFEIDDLEKGEQSVYSEAIGQEIHQSPTKVLSTDSAFFYYQNEYALDYNRFSPQPLHTQRYRGRLKFFDQGGNYGFIVMDGLNMDLFVHYDDLSRAGISKDKLANLKNHYQLRFEFTYFEYDGKQKKSKKAIDLVVLTE